MTTAELPANLGSLANFGGQQGVGEKDKEKPSERARETGSWADEMHRQQLIA